MTEEPTMSDAERNTDYNLGFEDGLALGEMKGATIEHLTDENAMLRAFIATTANNINVVGSHYDDAIKALDALVLQLKTESRAALKGERP